MSTGEKLKSLRKEKKLSIKEVADKIKISPEKIRALEEENYSFFASAFYARSFLKIYSKFLQLDIDPAREVEDNSPPSSIMPPADAIQVPEKKKPSAFSKIVGIIILLAAAAYLASIYFPEIKVSPEPENQAVGTKSPQPEFVEIKGVIHQPTWVRVTTDGQLREEALLTPPATKFYRADNHLRVKIGYTRGMDLYYRNRPDSEFTPVNIDQGSEGEVNELEFTKKSGK